METRFDSARKCDIDFDEEKKISTFAVVKNGIWYEKGNMGWFGMSSDTEEESKKWDESFFETWIKDLPEDILLTIVDCHI